MSNKTINLTDKTPEFILRSFRHIMQYPDRHSEASIKYASLTNLIHDDSLNGNQDVIAAMEVIWEQLRESSIDRTFKATEAGEILETVLVMNHMKIRDPSLNKAFYIIQNRVNKNKDMKSEQRYRIPKSLEAIKSIWREFRPVAHIACGLKYAQYDYKLGTNPYDKADPIEWLETTLAFQSLAFNTMLPRGAGSKLLNMGDDYLIETESHIAAELELQSDLEILEILKTYK